MAKRAKRTGSKAKGDKRARRAAVKARRAGADAGQNTDALVAQLPRVDALEDVPAFADLAADTRQRAAYEEFLDSCEAPDEMCLGCVVRLDRGFPLVVTEDELFRARHRRLGGGAPRARSRDGRYRARAAAPHSL